MRDEKTIEVEGRAITVRELTVEELDRMLTQTGDAEPTTLDGLLEEHGLTGAWLALFSGLTVAELSAMAPSRLQLVVAAAVEVNPDFFALARRRIDLARKLEDLGGQ